MALDWAAIDRWLMGEAWVGSQIEQHLAMLCQQIGPRWVLVRGRAAGGRLYPRTHGRSRAHRCAAGDFPLDTWEHGRATASVVAEGRVEDGRPIDLLPLLFCPPVDLRGSLLDVGFGMPHEVAAVREQLPATVAIVNLAAEPFSTPKPLADRLRSLQAGGAVAAVVVERKSGGADGVSLRDRMAHLRRARAPTAHRRHFAGGWRPPARAGRRRPQFGDQGTEPCLSRDRHQYRRGPARCAVAGRMACDRRPSRYRARLAGGQR